MYAKLPHRKVGNNSDNPIPSGTPMTNITTVLRAEITRLVRKELKSEARGAQRLTQMGAV